MESLKSVVLAGDITVNPYVLFSASVRGVSVLWVELVPLLAVLNMLLISIFVSKTVTNTSVNHITFNLRKG